MTISGTRLRLEPVQDDSTLRDFLQVVWRRKALLLLAILLIPCIAVLLSFRQETLYEASADVFLSHRNLALSLEGIDDPTVFQEPERIVQTHAALARSPKIATRVLNLSSIMDRTWRDFLDRSEVVAKPNSDLLEFKVTDSSPSLAMRLATEYANQFTIFRRTVATAGLDAALESVKDRIRNLAAADEEESRLSDSLAEREEQLETMKALETSNAFVVREANEAKRVQPNPEQAALIGLALAIVLGLGLVFLVEALDQGVRSPGQIAELLGLPLLGRLPTAPIRFKKQNQLVTLANPGGAGAEAFRTLRANLLLTNLEHGARTIMVTSVTGGEGKSMTVANLSVSLARAGARVVLVDLDLRRPYVDRLFDLTGRPGLTDVVLGEVTLDDAITPVLITEPEPDAPAALRANGRGDAGGVLEVLTSGPVPPDPGELVGSRAAAAILEQLRGRADFVLVDVPPLLQVGDAMALSPEVDALILVVSRFRLVRRPMLTELRRVLDSCPAAKLGFVVTGTELDEIARYGGSYSPASRSPRPKRGTPPRIRRS